jgi:hypothetical protein
VTTRRQKKAKIKELLNEVESLDRDWEDKVRYMQTIHNLEHLEKEPKYIV